jgi:hypothetical protein
MNSSSSTGFKVNRFKISLHLSTWLDNNSISFLRHVGLEIVFRDHEQ